MARNFVEYHIQEGAFHTFKVASGQTVKIGEVVEVVGDRTVQTAGPDSQKAIGVVYSGTVGKDGLNVGYVGDEGDVVTVVALKPLVYLEAGVDVNAGDKLASNGAGAVKPHASTETFSAGEYNAVIGIALEGATAGERFLAMLG